MFVIGRLCSTSVENSHLEDWNVKERAHEYRPIFQNV